MAGEKDTAFLNPSDILDFEKCVEFKNKLGNEESFKRQKDIDFINSFKSEVQKKENDKIEIYFEKFISNYSELKNLLEIGLDKTESSKKIGFLCKKSY